MNFLFTALIILLTVMHSRAQQAITNFGSLQMHGGANVTFYQNFSNTGTAAFVNNGTLAVRGNIANNQSGMANSSGSLQLNGNTIQEVSGSQTFRTFNLNTNNTAGITLNNNLSVGGSHTFATGMIRTSSTPHYLVYEAGSVYTGSADNRHVNGSVMKQGNTAFVFPVGNGSVLRSIELFGLSATSSFTARYAGPTTNTSNLGTGIVSVDPYEYWIVNRMSGGTAQINLNWDNSKIPFPMYALMDIRLAEYSSSLWVNRGGSATGDVLTTGTLTSGSLNSFGSFTFASMSVSLPLDFIHIDAKRLEDYSRIRWETENEKDVDYYEVERRNNIAKNFAPVGRTKARNSGATEDYEMRDYARLEDVAYYRIKSVDIDGRVGYSSVKVLSAQKSGSYRFSNPVTNEINMYADNIYAGDYAYEIVNASGQKVQSGQIRLVSGANKIRLNSTVVRGTYTLSLKSSDRRIAELLIVK